MATATSSDRCGRADYCGRRVRRVHDGYGWTFTTKAAGPPANATRVVVAADGSGDFNTVQGAVDWAPDHPAQRVTIFIKNGTYEEIVFFRKKQNLTIRGEDRDKVQVGYANNSGVQSAACRGRIAALRVLARTTRPGSSWRTFRSATTPTDRRRAC